MKLRKSIRKASDAAEYIELFGSYTEPFNSANIFYHG